MTRPFEAQECHNELIGHTCLGEPEDVHVRSRFIATTPRMTACGVRPADGTKTGIGRYEEQGGN